jgi:tetratricopeptide (TPR) repeat protein
MSFVHVLRADLLRIGMVGLVLAGLLVVSCGPPPADLTGPDELVVRVAPFSVVGQEEGGEYVGRAFAQSLAIGLGEANGLRVLDPEAPGEPDRRVRGVITRDGENVQVRLELRGSALDEPLWESEISSGAGKLSEMASRLARQTVQALGSSYPDLYDYVGNVSGGDGMSASPLTTRVQEAWWHRDDRELLLLSSRLVAEFPDEPSAQLINAWALLLAWSASPSAEALVELKERLTALDRVDPASPYDEIFLGYVYRSSGEPHKARVLFSRALARDDLFSITRAWALRQRCYTYLQEGNSNAAVGDAEQALELDPSNASSLLALSKSLETAGRYDEAASASRQALTLQPYQWRQHNRLGLVYARAKRFDEALVALERACELGKSQEACANFAVTLQRAGRVAEALAASDYAGSLAGTPWGRYNLACYWALAGQEATAIDNLRQAIDLGFANALIDTDPDLDSLRANPKFEAIRIEVEQRIQSRQQLSESVFPWQA